MSTIWRSAYHRCKNVHKQHINFKAFRRWLLSDAYKCEDAWVKRLKSPILTKVKFTPLSQEMFEKLESVGKSSVIDMDILANKMHEMTTEQVDFAESLLKRFHHTSDGLPVRDSVVHAVVRAYIQLGLTNRLLNLIRQRLTYGLLPDFYTTNILMDEFIKQSKFKEASLLATEMALQEDISHPITRLLSVYACVKHYNEFYIDVENLKTEDPPQPEGEEVKVVISIFPRPYYDDHFDITNEKFLHGKTMYFLGKNTEGVLGRSLQLIGLGLYEKFPKAFDLLRKWTSEIQTDVVYSKVLEDFGIQLENAAKKDPEVGIKEQAIRTIDDEIYQLRITPDEKEKYMEELKDLGEKLRSLQALSLDDMESYAENCVKQEIGTHEGDDINNQVTVFDQWNKEREKMLEEQISEYKRKQKEEEIQQRLIELEEKEALLTVFNKKTHITRAAKLYEKKDGKKKVVKELTELEKEEEEERQRKHQQKRKI